MPMLPGEESFSVGGLTAAKWCRSGGSSGIGVIMLHAHPQMNGSMDDGIILSILEMLHESSHVAVTLRFDFDKDLSTNSANVLDFPDTTEANPQWHIPLLAFLGLGHGLCVVVIGISNLCRVCCAVNAR